ncbi:MAG: WG repeat-containing protein [Oscillospiraceae bacterium]|nr:WG repeat-containing protein [Oscillospiraceae bacterium]
MRMKRGLCALLAVLLCLSMAACGDEPEVYGVTVISPEQTSVPGKTPAPSAAQPAADDGLNWLVEPDASIEWVQSLADYPQNSSDPMTHREELYLFSRGGKVGVIDLRGHVVVPESENVHWCGLCGIVNADETKIFNAAGQVVGSGGHGAYSSIPLYDEVGGQLYYVDYGEYVPWGDTMLGGGPFMAQVVRISARPLAEGEEMKDDFRFNADGTISVLEVEETGMYILVDGSTGRPLSEVRYEEHKLCKSGMFPVKRNGLWGYVDEYGVEQIACKYENVLPFDSGTAAVRMNGGWRYINLADVYQTDDMDFEEVATACGGKAWVKTAAGWGVMALADCVKN